MEKKVQLSSNILTAFTTWYFRLAPKNIVEIWGNSFKAIWYYFAIGLLLRTLFAPWHRDTTGYGRGFEFRRYLEVWSLNMVARFVGFVVRSVTILAAVIVQIFILILGFVFLSFWILAPISLTVAFFWGLILLL